MSTDKIDLFLSGQLNEQQTVLLFSDIIRNGALSDFDDVISFTAIRLIEAGWLDREGNVSLEVFEL
jgi:hypothetical protein